MEIQRSVTMTRLGFNKTLDPMLNLMVPIEMLV